MCNDDMLCYSPFIPVLYGILNLRFQLLVEEETDIENRKLLLILSYLKYFSLNSLFNVTDELMWPNAFPVH